MKTLYSSTFLSAVLGILMLIGQSETSLELQPSDDSIQFRSIFPYNKSNAGPVDHVNVKVYTHFNCLDCQEFGRSILATLHEMEEKEGKMELEIFFVPSLDDENDILASKAAHCAGEQGLFWNYIEKLFVMEGIDSSQIQTAVTELEMNAETFNVCLNSDESQQKIESNLIHWEALNIGKRPSTIVGNTLLLGAHPVENIEREIRRKIFSLPPVD